MITENATTAACQASFLRVRADRPLVSPRNTGTIPGGSMITNSVTNACKKNVIAAPLPPASRGWSRGGRRGQRQQPLVLLRRRRLAAETAVVEGTVVVAAARHDQVQRVG